MSLLGIIKYIYNVRVCWWKIMIRKRNGVYNHTIVKRDWRESIVTTKERKMLMTSICYIKFVKCYLDHRFVAHRRSSYFDVITPPSNPTRMNVSKHTTIRSRTTQLSPYLVSKPIQGSQSKANIAFNKPGSGVVKRPCSTVQHIREQSTSLMKKLPGK